MLLFCAHQSATVAMFDFFNSTDLSPSLRLSLTLMQKKKENKTNFDCAYSIRRALLFVQFVTNEKQQQQQKINNKENELDRISGVLNRF